MTAPIDHSLHYYLGRAKAMRAFATAIADPTTRMAVLHVADSYKRLAERAERREELDGQGRVDNG